MVGGVYYMMPRDGIGTRERSLGGIATLWPWQLRNRL